MTTNKTVAHFKCKCVNEFQDKRYGPQVRVMNRTAKESGTTTDARCTVCGAIHQVPTHQFH